MTDRECLESLQAQIADQLHPPVDCVWQEWETWLEWSGWVPVGDGTEARTRTRTRTIASPASHGGADCVGPSEETETEPRPIVVVPPPPRPGAHRYFESLIVRPDHYQSFSLRSEAQLRLYQPSPPHDITYNFVGDPDPRRQDAAKVVVPVGRNSLPKQIHLPISHRDGEGSIVLTWDGWLGREFGFDTAGIGTYKHFQVCSPDQSIWCEIRAGFHRAPLGAVAELNGRVYRGPARTEAESFGPNVTGTGTLAPQAAPFALPPEEWVRYWALFEPIDGWDCYSLWAASVTQAPVLVFDRLQIRYRADTDGVHKLGVFRLEFNTSTNDLMPGRGPLVAYVRNVVMLRGVAAAAMPALLQQPQP